MDKGLSWKVYDFFFRYIEKKWFPVFYTASYIKVEQVGMKYVFFSLTIIPATKMGTQYQYANTIKIQSMAQ